MADESPRPQDKSTESARPAERRTKLSGEKRLTSAPRREPTGDLSGTVLGDFLLLRRVGSGGMGEVYLAQQVSLKRQVAIKVLRADLSADETAAKRFVVEAEAAAKLTHANIVQIYAFGQHDHTSYMALEYVQGMNLRDFVTRKGPAGARFAIRVMEQVASALHHAAEAGVVHRDIKPDNILLTRRGEAKVADFGLARLRAEVPVHLTQTGMTMGTPLYMSPEQVEGKPLDARSDLYSFGVTCYFMLTGQPPFRGATAMAVAVQHIKGEPAPLEDVRSDLPAQLLRIVEKLMAKNPDQRYQTGRQVMRDLEKLRTELGPSDKDAAATETRAAPVPRDRMLSRIFRAETMRRHLLWWFAASLVLALSAGAGYGWYHRAPDLQPRAAQNSVQPPAAAWEQVRRQETPKAQYEYALAVGQFDKENPEAAWLAVINGFPLETEWVWRAQMQLGRLYLDKHQLDKAETHFKQMTADPNRRTQLAGEVGKAAVLCLRDRPQESLDALWDLIQGGEIGSDRTLLGLVLWTFERNYRNLGKPDWDPQIRRWANQKLEQFRPPLPMRP